MCIYQISYNFYSVVNKVSLVFVQIFNPFSKVENMFYTNPPFNLTIAFHWLQIDTFFQKRKCINL